MTDTVIALGLITVAVVIPIAAIITDRNRPRF